MQSWTRALSAQPWYRRVLVVVTVESALWCRRRLGEVLRAGDG